MSEIANRVNEGTFEPVTPDSGRDINGADEMGRENVQDAK